MKTFKSYQLTELEEGSSDTTDMYALMVKGLKSMPGSPKQKEIIKQINVIRKRMGMKLMKEDFKFDEASKLPPHLAKFFDKKGNPKPEVAARIRKARALKGVKITDVTPDWMFPNEEVEEGFQEISNLVDITQEVMGKMIKAMKKDDFRTVTKLYKELGKIIK